MITKQRFQQLVKDFEYGIINRCRVGAYTISWQPADQTCFMFKSGQVIQTGGFEELLDLFVEEIQEAA